MPKVTLNRDMFKALASDTRLEILRVLDGKKMGLNDICKATNLNKATLHEHLGKLHEAGLVKKHERTGHKWVYYQLSWKGESLLHPENTRIVVLFSTTFILLLAGLIQMYWYIKGSIMSVGYETYNMGKSYLVTDGMSVPEAADVYRNCGNMTSIPEPLQTLFTQISESSTNTTGLNEYATSGGSLSLDSELYVMQWYSQMQTPFEKVTNSGGQFFVDESEGIIQAIYQNPFFLYAGIICISAFVIILCYSLWRYWENKKVKI